MSDTVYTRLTADQAIDRIKGGVDTLVICHVHPDADALGSAFALRALLMVMGCRVYCACQDEIPERLRFLTEGLQESVLVSNLPSDFAVEQIITVDTAAPGQMGTLFDLYGDRVDLMLDHHGKGTMYADGWVQADAAATGEMIFTLAQRMVDRGLIPTVPSMEKLLYAAISSDTGCFRYNNVTPNTHRVAAELLHAAAEGMFDPADINHKLFEVKSAKLLLAEKLAFDRLHLYADGKIGIVDFPVWLKEKYELTDEHLETLVDIPRGMEGVEVAVAIRQPGHEGVYRASMRSNCDFDVSAVCAAFGGGGHVRAAGCTITCDGDMEAVVNMVADAIVRKMF